MRGRILTKKSKPVEAPTEPERAPSGALKRRRRGNRNLQSHCGCGAKLKTRCGLTRCPTHGQSWFSGWPKVNG
jgi:hypothetical protein